MSLPTRIVTDSRDFEITLEIYPDDRITDLKYPYKAHPGDTVTISWTVTNYGGDTGIAQYIRLIDRDTGEELKKDVFMLGHNASKSGSWSLTMPNKNWLLRVEAGYEYGGMRYPTSGYDLSIVTEAPMLNLLLGAIPVLAVGGVIGFNEFRRRV